MAIWHYRGDRGLGGVRPPSWPPAAGAKDAQTDEPLTDYYSTGAEAMAYYLLGPRGQGFIVKQSGMTKSIAPHHLAAADEIRTVFDTSIKSDGNWMGVSPAPTAEQGHRRVFVDKYSSLNKPDQAEKTRPILYWSAYNDVDADGNYYRLSDNEAIVKNVSGQFHWSKADYAVAFKKSMKYRGDRYLKSFVLQSAGEDRMFMTDDDVLVWDEDH
jgi:hypothetical protein